MKFISDEARLEKRIPPRGEERDEAGKNSLIFHFILWSLSKASWKIKQENKGGNNVGKFKFQASAALRES